MPALGVGSARLDDAASLAQPSHAPPPGLQDLPVEGFLPSVVSWPSTQSFPQPTLIAAHGAGGWAQWHCRRWRERLGARGVILCPRGRAMRVGSEDDGYYYPDHHALADELKQALASLQAQYPDHVDTRDPAYAGYSQGAQMGLLALLDMPGLAPYLLLAEGGAGDFTLARARRFAQGGGRGVALVCGTPGCLRRAQRSARVLSQTPVEVQVYHAPGAGHTPDGAVAARMGEAFARLLRHDPRW